MAQEKLGFEQFIEAVDTDNKPFVLELHNHLIASGCKAAFEEKKAGYVASYKIGKPQKALLNFVFKKNGLMCRVYGERIGSYPEFFDNLPKAMLGSIQKAGVCKRLTENGCNPKCIGYDFMIGGEHFQKCRYSCFEFLMTDESNPFIKTFALNEVAKRMEVM